MNKMTNLKDIIESIKFVIYGQVHDYTFLGELFSKIEKYQKQDKIDEDDMRSFNVILHYMAIKKIKSVKIKIGKGLEKKLKGYWVENYQKGNYINSIELFKEK